MDGVLFEEWVRELDRKFEAEGRNIALLIDNCPAHPEIGNLKALALKFLRPNTTSRAQTMDQGVIRSLKAKYRKNVVRKFIRSLDKNLGIPKISILNAMQMLVSSWNSVTTEAIVNCFRASRISPETQDLAITDSDDPFAELQEEIETLRASHPEFVPDMIDATPLVDVDADVAVSQPVLTDAEILSEFLGGPNDQDEEDDDVEEIEIERRAI